ncbi:unnamed protein product (macronuclear) [Paramecium tetraurelia]|uniref:Uncharacterized protein n=1 Tax=Paramecium tetraurelia TaxID=5888 RepID=A0DZE5_PARTE|nr:uncharacterized protein GSPATT00021579001 [Paramecium tetraurelia]CAK88412.1 unnamed protein product [Paramecium tetraurelia]|eukprot:XP_001455809.1 hypothetical protein (macronuclear) [Paramecium tetraurelia strain d4-2]
MMEETFLLDNYETQRIQEKLRKRNEPSSVLKQASYAGNQVWMSCWYSRILLELVLEWVQLHRGKLKRAILGSPQGLLLQASFKGHVRKNILELGQFQTTTMRMN